MPNLSPTMEKGNIGVWYKQIGDKISVGDVLCSIETDKATVDFEMQEEGYLAKTFFDAGSKDIPLGEILAILAESPDDIGAFKNFTPGAAPAAPSQPAAATPTTSPVSS